MAPEECEGRQCEEEEPCHARGDGYYCTHGSPGGDADDAGVGHGVAEEPLHRCSGNSQGDADRGPDQYARKPDLFDHELLGAVELRCFEPQE